MLFPGTAAIRAAKPAGLFAAWNRLLRSPAAAPVLRAGRRSLGGTQCAALRPYPARALRDSLTLFDVDTAASLLLLAWKGSNTGLCLRILDTIQQECESGWWSLRDIPQETWAGLADLFAAADPELAGRRGTFAALMDEQMAELFPVLPAVSSAELQLVELGLHMLRIGSPGFRDRLLKGVLEVGLKGKFDPEMTVSVSRPWFLLLLRWARENDETDLMSALLSDSTRAWWTHFGAAGADGPDAIDLDRACACLTYREAMDLRWALGLWRDSVEHRPRGPRRRRPASQ